MAVRKPIVIVSGQLQQLQSGDTISGVDSGIVSLTNENANAIVIGTPVYASNASMVDLACANAIGTSEVVGLVSDTSVNANAAGGIKTSGILDATTGQWDAVTNESGGLVANSIYFLDPDTAGMLTPTAPTVDGDLVVRVGKALNTTQMIVSIQPPILL